MDFLKKFNRRSSPQPRGICGITFGQQDFAIVHALPNVQSRFPQLTRCHYQRFENDTDRSAGLSEWIRTQELQHTECTWVLRPQEYRLLLLDAPNVEDSELHDAIHWQIKDFIDFPLDEAVVDVFKISPYGPGQQHKKVYVVVGHLPYLQRGVEWIQNSGLQLTAINISELILCQLSHFFINPQDRSISMFLTTNNNWLLMMHANQLYFARNIEIGQQALFESLLSEAQRSIRYYESEFGLGTPTKLLLASIHMEENYVNPEVVSHLTTQLNITVEMIEPQFFFKTIEAITPEKQKQCFMAMGGTLECNKK